MGSHWGEEQRPEHFGGPVVRTDVKLERNGFKRHGGSETALKNGGVRVGHGRNRIWGGSFRVLVAFLLKLGV